MSRNSARTPRVPSSLHACIRNAITKAVQATDERRRREGVEGRKMLEKNARKKQKAKASAAMPRNQGQVK